MRMSDWSSDVCSSDLAVVGMDGLAPYWFEVGAQAFLSDKGDAHLRLEGSYDQRITQRLILQPAAEIDIAAQDVPELGIGSGLSDVELGLRLRYEFAREFAPYVGVNWRSEEHTSELQSLMRISYAVLCLKKKNSTRQNTRI